jgi:DNA-binding CsgD family transcriptional regulator
LCAPFWKLQLAWPGYNKFADLARRHDPVATLHDATDGELSRAPVYAQMYSQLGAADELRAAFVPGSSCWGIVALVRASEDGPFPDHEVAAVRSLCRFLARAFRHYALRLRTDSAQHLATVVVDPDNQIQHTTVEGRSILADIHNVHHVLASPEEADLTSMCLGLITRARANRAGSPIATRVRGISGQWYRLPAARTEPGDGHVALTIEPARIDLIPLILEGFGLTEREISIVVYLARGLATRDIASELSLSVHTVRDHIKAIFTKCGVRSRGELVARLFSEHLAPAVREHVHHAN